MTDTRWFMYWIHNEMMLTSRGDERSSTCAGKDKSGFKGTERHGGRTRRSLAIIFNQSLKKDTLPYHWKLETLIQFLEWEVD